MTFQSWLGFVSAGAMATSALVGIGCSSSSPHGVAMPDAALQDTSVIDSPVDSYAPSDSSHPTDAPESADAGGGDCGPVMSAVGFKPSTYVPAVGHQGVCSPAQVAEFVNDCVAGTSATACDTWQTTNLPSDAGAGTPCGNCILAPDNNGGLWIDPTGSFWPNWAGCIQLTDPTNGPACAAAANNVDGCVDTACDGICDVDTEYCGGTACTACSNQLNSTTCKSYSTTATTACTPAQAAVSACTNASGGQVMNFTDVILLICGPSPADAGHD